MDTFSTNLEFVNSRATDLSGDCVKSDDIQKLGSAVATTAKAYEDVRASKERIEIELRREEREERRYEYERKRNRRKDAFDIIKSLIELGLATYSTYNIVNLGRKQRYDETEHYIEAQNTNRLQFDTLKKHSK